MNPKFLQNEGNAYKSTLAFGITNIDVVKEFHTVYPTSFSWISYFADTNTFQIWNSEVGLYQRYVLTLQLNVNVNPSKLTLTVLGKPHFSLVEMNSVSPAGGGSFATSCSEICKFSTRKWGEVFRANGNLKVLGLNIKTNQPVKNFDKALTNR